MNSQIEPVLLVAQRAHQRGEPVGVQVLGLVDDDRVVLGAELADRLDQRVGQLVVPVLLRRRRRRSSAASTSRALRQLRAERVEGVEVEPVDLRVACRWSRSARLKQTNSTRLPSPASSLRVLDREHRLARAGAAGDDHPPVAAEARQQRRLLVRELDELPLLLVEEWSAIGTSIRTVGASSSRSIACALGPGATRLSRAPRW